MRLALAGLVGIFLVSNACGNSTETTPSSVTSSSVSSGSSSSSTTTPAPAPAPATPAPSPADPAPPSTPPAPTPAPAPAPAMSALTVMLKDSPFSDAKSLLVTFSEVEVHASGGDWVTVPFAGGASSRTCDLKKLETAQDVLGVGPLPAGHYTQLRLVVSSATIYFDNASAGPACAPSIAAPAGANAPVDIPSGELKLNREFDLASAGGTTMLLDFDGDQSVKLTGSGNGNGRGNSGKYMMTPVIGIVSVH